MGMGPEERGNIAKDRRVRDLRWQPLSPARRHDERDRGLSNRLSVHQPTGPRPLGGPPSLPGRRSATRGSVNAP